jgi:uncharacterized protein involved in exopolysaccharide biosynthesis
MEMEERELSLLDLLLVVAENLRLLVLGPILVGAVAWGVMSFMPPNYTSQAILSLPSRPSTIGTSSTSAASTTPAPPTPQEVASMLVSPLVLDPVIESQGLRAGRPLETVRAELASRVRTSVGKDNLLHLDVTARSPEQAQQLAQAILASWIQSTTPSERERDVLQRRLAAAKASLVSMRQALDRLTRGGRSPAAVESIPQQASGGVSLIVAMGEMELRYLGEVASIEQALQGVSPDVIKQAPLLPTNAVATRRSLITAVSALAAGLFLLLGVLIRQAWRNAARTPENAEKQARILAALRWGR